MRHRWWFVGLMLGATRLPAQIDFQNNHWAHLSTKPMISGAVYLGARAVHRNPRTSTAFALLAPLAVATVRLEVLYPGSWKTSGAWKDHVADTWASALAPILLRLRGWTRAFAGMGWATVEFGWLARWSRP